MTSNEVTAATWSDKGDDTDTDYNRVLRHVRTAGKPVGPAATAKVLGITVLSAQRLLSAAASRGEVVRLTRGLYAAVTADPADRLVPNLSTAAAAKYQPRDVVTASGRMVTVAPELIRDRMSRTRTAAVAPGSGGDAAQRFAEKRTAEARLAALGAIFMTGRDSWTGSPEDHQVLGAWVASLPNSVLPLDMVAELLTSARATKIGDVQGGAK